MCCSIENSAQISSFRISRNLRLLQSDTNIKLSDKIVTSIIESSAQISFFRISRNLRLLQSETNIKLSGKIVCKT